MKMNDLNFSIFQQYQGNIQYKKSKRSFKSKHLYFVSRLSRYPSSQPVLFAFSCYQFVLEQFYVRYYTLHRDLLYLCHSFHFIFNPPNLHCFICSTRSHNVRLLQCVKCAYPTLVSIRIFKHSFASPRMPEVNRSIHACCYESLLIN